MGIKSKSVAPPVIKILNIEAEKSEMTKKERFAAEREYDDDTSPEALQKVKDSLHDFDKIDLTQRPARKLTTGWWDYINYTWTQDIIEHCS